MQKNEIFLIKLWNFQVGKLDPSSAGNSNSISQSSSLSVVQRMESMENGGVSGSPGVSSTTETPSEMSGKKLKFNP